MRLRRDPFRDVVARQLDLFVEDEADLLEECRERFRPTSTRIARIARRRTATSPTPSRRQPRRSRTCATGSPARSTRMLPRMYEDSFNRAVRKRWPELGLEIENR